MRLRKNYYLLKKNKNKIDKYSRVHNGLKTTIHRNDDILHIFFIFVKFLKTHNCGI